MTSLQPAEEDVIQRNDVMRSILDHIKTGTTIKLPDFDPTIDRPSDRFALQSVGLEPNAFGGRCADFRYQFEGEEDLLHLIVTRTDGLPLSPKDGQAVAAFLLNGVSPALIWLRPGEYSQHFYVGHDELVDHLLI